jgi:site-specific recombinase XerD
MPHPPKLPVPVQITALTATTATTDEAIVQSWLDNMGSPHTRRNFETTALRFLAALGMPLRAAKLEHVREALARMTAGLKPASARQYVLRVKSLLSYAQRLGYLPFNAGATIRVKIAAPELSKRIITQVDVSLLVRAAGSKRDRLLIELAYAGGLRVSELVGLTWADVLQRSDGRVQLHVRGKGNRVRQVLLPEVVGRSLLSLRGEAGPDDPVFQSRKAAAERLSRHPRALSERAVNQLLKRIAAKADINPDVSAHWLRHAHASHALDKGAALSVVQATLGHSNVSTTSAYLHARPDTSSGLFLDEGVFLR